MKRILIIFVIGFIYTSVQAQMDNPLKDGMPNTVTLANGDIIYDLSGEWDATFNTGGWGTFNAVVKFTQKDNQFIGIVLNNIRTWTLNRK